MRAAVFALSQKVQKNLAIVVLDNERYGGTGGQTSHTL
jgi:pyruvate/2-oxoacid:ferredoxin oxidoreductase beta subunit